VVKLLHSIIRLMQVWKKTALSSYLIYVMNMLLVDLFNLDFTVRNRVSFSSSLLSSTQLYSQQQAALLADLLSQQKNYQREQDLSLEAAKQDALARRAAKYKIGA
jgi:hypothetical protein